MHVSVLSKLGKSLTFFFPLQKDVSLGSELKLSVIVHPWSQEVRSQEAGECHPFMNSLELDLTHSSPTWDYEDLCALSLLPVPHSKSSEYFRI